MVAYEKAAVRRFGALLVTSQVDAQALGGGKKVHVSPMGVDLCAFTPGQPGDRETATLIFSGNMGYHPNEEAALWFAANVWPLVKAAHPGARWQIAGANPGPRLRSLENAERGIEVLAGCPTWPLACDKRLLPFAHSSPARGSR